MKSFLLKLETVFLIEIVCVGCIHDAISDMVSFTSLLVCFVSYEQFPEINRFIALNIM